MSEIDSKFEEDNLRNLTISSFKRINENLYLINYQNNYYLNDIINEGVKNQDQVRKFANKKFGINLKLDSENNPASDSCSCFNVFNKNSQNLLGRNFDLPFNSPTLVVWTHPSDGYKSISFIFGGFSQIFDGDKIIKENILCSVYDIIDGCNEKGLAIGMLKISKTKATHQNDPLKKNVTSGIMMKGALDYCKNITEVIEYFNKYNMHEIVEGYTLQFFIVDSNGDSIILEYIDNKMEIIKPHQLEFSKYLYATNFLLLKPIGPGNENGVDRFNILKDKLKDDKNLEKYEAMNLLNNVHKNTTIWSNVYNTNELKVITALSQKYDILYEFDINQPNEYKIISL